MSAPTVAEVAGYLAAHNVKAFLDAVRYFTCSSFSRASQSRNS